jgi:hypothetical protein
VLVIFPHFGIWSIFHFKFTFFPCLADAQVVADELKFGAVTTETSICVPVISWNSFHFGLRHGAVVVVLAVGAPTTTRLFFVHLHGFANCDPEGLVGCWLIGWILRAKHPVVDSDLGVLFVLGCGDEFFLHRQAHKALGHHHEFVHVVLLD